MKSIQLLGCLMVSGLGLCVASAGAQTSQGLVDVRMNGDVRCIQPMGDGSFVLGGFTSYYNGVRDTGLLRITSAGARVAWPVSVDGNVYAIALNGGWLYLGGDFQTVNSASVPFIARVNAVTGAVDATWRPAPNGDIIDLVPVANGVVIAGSFSKVGGLSRSRLALVVENGAGRALETWRCDADAQVDCLAASGGKIFVGGRFKRLNNTVINYLARINGASGAVEASWNPTPQFHVFDIEADASHLYVGGSFSRLGSGGPPFLGRVGLTTGTVDTSWSPNPDGLITRLTVSGDSVYAAGTFLNIGSTPHRWIMRAVKTASGADVAWRPPINGSVMAMAADGSNGVWAAGRFDSGGAGAGFARFTSTQATTAPTYPGKVENVGAVKSIVSLGSGAFLIGGDFDTVNGVRRPGIFRLNGTVVDGTWSAGLGGPYPTVNAMALIPGALGGAEVQIAGQFEVKPQSLILYNCLRLKVATGAVQTGFAPQPDNQVTSMVQHEGRWVLGGFFNKLFNTSLTNLGRIDDGGNADAGWKPQPNGAVYSLYSANSELYVGGTFTSFGIAPTIYPSPYLARLAVTVPDLAWQPRPNQAVMAMVGDGSSLYIGGRFTSMARSRRQYLAQIPMGGAGTATSWNPRPNNAVYSLLIDSSHLFVGGGFSSIANFQWPKLARFSRSNLGLDTTYRTTGEDGVVTALFQPGDGSLMVGGSFSGWDDVFTKKSLVKITGATAASPVPEPFSSNLEENETLAAYFSPESSASLQVTSDGFTWVENPTLPPGMVARAQWSHNMTDWYESGASADGLTRYISISANGNARRAEITTLDANTGQSPRHSVSNTLFLRLLVTEGEPHALRQP